MLLPQIYNATVSSTGSNRLEGYLGAPPDYSGVRINFVIRPDLDYAYFTTFIGQSVVANTFIDGWGTPDMKYSAMPADGVHLRG